MTYFRPTEEKQKAVDDLLQSLADPGDLISNVVVVAKVMTEDGQLIIRSIDSTGTDWLTRRVMMDVAHEAELDLS